MGKHSTAKILKRFSNFRYILVLEGILVGTAAGLVTVLFRLLLNESGTWLQNALYYGRGHPFFIPIWFGVLLLAALLVTLLLKWEPLIGGSGIPQVEGELQGHIRTKWWRVLLAKFSGGILTIGCGLALGREGPSIQLGAMAGKGVSRLAGRARTEEKLLMTCGASAGLAAAFNAPLAGVLFSLEELHKNFSLEVLLSAMASSVTADFISRNIFGMKPVFDFTGIAMMPLKNYWLVLILGVLLGLFAMLYNRCTDKIQNLYGRIQIPYLKIVIPFILAGILGFTYPNALGGGHELIGEMTTGVALPALCLLLFARFAFSQLSFGSGVPGGIFLPLLVLGAAGGSLFGGIAQALGIDLNLSNFIILGMAGFFAAVVRAPVTGILLICEMTGTLSHMLSLTLVSLVAYIAADLLGVTPIYDQLLKRILRNPKSRKGEPDTGEKILIDTPVHMGAAVCGRRISQINWPTGCLLVSVQRGERELVPKGDTVLRAGDGIVVLCDENDSRQAYTALEKLCRHMAEQR